ncbi:MAG: histidine phosphatase family protein [Synergistaceae bacterium]|jgi:alpha-ribazole phosphatase/probable phosphoglycerate mutase|nr:histidine phosphatase family protein [Synergistaceae bacterium]
MSRKKKELLRSKAENTRENHRIFFIRHGETDWNKNFRYQGLSDVELNEFGLEQARRLGLRLAKTEPTRVVSSPLARALRTAEEIMRLNSGSAPIETMDDLREISFGCWEGLTFSEVSKRYPDTYGRWRLAPFSVTPDGGESIGEIIERSRGAADDIVRRGVPGGVTFIVAHGAILRSLLASMMNVSDIDLMWMMRLDNCSLTVLDFWGSHPSLLTLNDTHHTRMSERDIARLVFHV